MLSTGMEVLHSSNAMFAETMAERPLLVTVRFVTDLRSALSNWQKSFSCVLPGRMKWGVPTKMMAMIKSRKWWRKCCSMRVLIAFRKMRQSIIADLGK